jgi:hypothetical protein
MSGAFVVLRADGGSIKIVDQGTASASIRPCASPVQRLDEDMARAQPGPSSGR